MVGIITLTLIGSYLPKIIVSVKRDVAIEGVSISETVWAFSYVCVLECLCKGNPNDSKTSLTQAEYMAAANKHKHFLALGQFLLKLKDFYRLKDTIWRACSFKIES